MLANPQGSSALLPELYTVHDHSSNHWIGWGESTNPGLIPAQASQPQFASLNEAFSQNQYGADGSDNFISEMFTGPFIGLAYRPRRSSVDYSDGSSASQSIHSSATFSNAHLPLSTGDMYRDASEEFQQRMLLDPQCRRDSMSSGSGSGSAPNSHTSSAINILESAKAGSPQHLDSCLLTTQTSLLGFQQMVYLYSQTLQ
ncbi:hypothetical protein BDR03DRAFT_1017349 [Suillus americanus]|nr:hypothetical protein BDR03DRAFT_1017349 [Suillus americanus]